MSRIIGFICSLNSNIKIMPHNILSVGNGIKMMTKQKLMKDHHLGIETILFRGENITRGRPAWIRFSEPIGFLWLCWSLSKSKSSGSSIELSI